MNDDSGTRDSGWRLDKRIPVSLLAMLAFQTAGLLIWGVHLDSRVTANEMALADFKSGAIKAESFARLDEKMNGVKDDISSLKTEFGTVKDEMRRMSVRGK